jgi:hypothetical protein
MRLKITRHKFTSKTTQGSLYIDGQWAAFTLEDKYQFDLKTDTFVPKKSTFLPPGIYRVVLAWSEELHSNIPQILDGTHHTGFCVCPSGSNDSHGEEPVSCIFVGLSRAPDYVGQSRQAFEIIMNYLEKATAQNEDIELEIVHEPYNQIRR